jgi:hypothetical protein
VAAVRMKYGRRKRYPDPFFGLIGGHAYVVSTQRVLEPIRSVFLLSFFGTDVGASALVVSKSNYFYSDERLSWVGCWVRKSF